MSLLKRTRLRLKEKLFPVNIPYLTQSKYIIRTKNNFFFFYRITIYIFCQSTLYYTRIVSDFLGKIARQFRGQARRNPNNLTFEKIRPPLGQLSALSDLLRGTKNGIKKIFIPPKFQFKTEPPIYREIFVLIRAVRLMSDLARIPIAGQLSNEGRHIFRILFRVEVFNHLPVIHYDNGVAKALVIFIKGGLQFRMVD